MPFNAIIYLIVELLVALIILPSIADVALLSKEQGRSWLRWMLLSLLITPFLSLLLFLYLLDELIDLFYALATVLLWRKYVHDLVKRVTKVAELSAHNEYCSYRLREV